ncbi:hypothetical protein M9Y82_17400 [Leptospira weilii]|nr:hypothetical protein [Leptospira weilii]MCL8268374.1 hypothetical protein [Leptospira weilii]
MYLEIPLLVGNVMGGGGVRRQPIGQWVTTEIDTLLLLKREFRFYS